MESQNERLIFRIADAEKDGNYIFACGRSAWIAVYGNDRRYNEDFYRSNTAAIMRHRNDNIIIAESLSGEKAGICIIDSRVPEQPKTGHISLFYLEEGFRYRGLGALLMEAAEKHCRARGCMQMRLFVSNSNRPAKHFYAKHGYEKRGEQLSPFSGQTVLRKNL